MGWIYKTLVFPECVYILIYLFLHASNVFRLGTLFTVIHLNLSSTSLFLLLFDLLKCECLKLRFFSMNFGKFSPILFYFILIYPWILSNFSWGSQELLNKYLSRHFSYRFNFFSMYFCLSNENRIFTYIIHD